MKLAIVAVLCAMVLAAECHVVAWPGWPTWPSWPGAVWVAPPHIPPVVVKVEGEPEGPKLIVSEPAAPVVVTVPEVEGTYVAKTRGAVHVAPLPGHSQSATIVNLEPAPGTE